MGLQAASWIRHSVCAFYNSGGAQLSVCLGYCQNKLSVYSAIYIWSKWPHWKSECGISQWVRKTQTKVQRGIQILISTHSAQHSVAMGLQAASWIRHSVCAFYNSGVAQLSVCLGYCQNKLSVYSAIYIWSKWPHWKSEWVGKKEAEAQWSLHVAGRDI